MVRDEPKTRDEINAKNSSLDANLVTAVNGTDDCKAHSKRWIAVLVQVRSEKAVGKQLTKLGIGNYVPTQTEIHQWSDRKKKVERIVIPSIVFIHADKENTKETPHPKINVAAVREYNYAEVLPHIELLTKYSTEVRIPEMVIEMKEFVPEFKSKNSVYEMYDKK